uniref:Uncharacterized protein n=1 Tax=Arundo donax TaxID=35708 RepID=A0A0A8Z4J1_ARUDO
MYRFFLPPIESNFIVVGLVWHANVIYAI